VVAKVRSRKSAPVRLVHRDEDEAVERRPPSSSPPAWVPASASIFRAPSRARSSRGDPVQLGRLRSVGADPGVRCRRSSRTPIFTVVHGRGTLFHTPALAFSRPIELVGYFMLALVLVGAGWLYVRAFYKTHDAFQRWKFQPGSSRRSAD